MHYQAFIIYFNLISFGWKQNPDFIKGEAKFSSTPKS